ncbi:MAG: aromatic aminobenezylarsenical efflux permease ArsG family transporter [Candidatus Zixiibacteriota bacterium]
MIDSWWLGAASAFWLGILTSVSPCPLAANIAAVTFIGKHLASPRRIVASGAAYAVGRVIAYVALGALLVAGVATASRLSDLLLSSMSRILGPLLIVVGMVLLELINVPIPNLVSPERWHERATSGGAWNAGLLGFVFALSFCPISAALFFGSLIPLSVRHGSHLMYPALYGIGTGLPVVIFGVGLGLGARWVAGAMHRLTQLERWARRATGVVFIAVGIYLTLKYIFGVV